MISNIFKKTILFTLLTYTGFAAFGMQLSKNQKKVALTAQNFLKLDYEQKSTLLQDLAQQFNHLSNETLLEQKIITPLQDDLNNKNIRGGISWLFDFIDNINETTDLQPLRMFLLFYNNCPKIITDFNDNGEFVWSTDDMSALDVTIDEYLSSSSKETPQQDVQKNINIIELFLSKNIFIDPDTWNYFFADHALLDYNTQQLVPFDTINFDNHNGKILLKMIQHKNFYITQTNENKFIIDCLIEKEKTNYVLQLLNTAFIKYFYQTDTFLMPQQYTQYKDTDWYKKLEMLCQLFNAMTKGKICCQTARDFLTCDLQLPYNRTFDHNNPQVVFVRNVYLWAKQYGLKNIYSTIRDYMTVVSLGIQKPLPEEITILIARKLLQKDPEQNVELKIIKEEIANQQPPLKKQKLDDTPSSFNSLDEVD